ncbi:MAG: MFS transporter [Veillonella sp.]|nr:MFS transporter [Veillonella sp.]
MKQVYILTVCMTIVAVSYSMLAPILPIYVLTLGIPESEAPRWAGVAFSVMFLVSALMAPLWGRLADKYGRKWMVVRAGVLMGITYILSGLANDPWSFVASRVVMGFANGFMPAAITVLSLSVPPDKIGKSMGIFQTGATLGTVVGPIVGGFLQYTVGMKAVFYLAGIVVFVVGLAIIVLIKEPTVSGANDAAISNKMSGAQNHNSEGTGSDNEGNHGSSEGKHSSSDGNRGWLWLLRSPGIASILGLFFIMQSALYLVQPIISLYIASLYGTIAEAAVWAGLMFGIGGLCSVFTTRWWMKLGDNVGYDKAFSYTLAGAGLCIGLQSVVRGEVGIFLFGVLQVISMACLVGASPLLSAALSERSLPTHRGRVFGLSTMSQQMGQTIGPLCAGIFGEWLGLSYVFALAGTALVVVAVSRQVTFRKKYVVR